MDLDTQAMEAARLWKSPRSPCFPTVSTRFAQARAERLPFSDGAFSKVLAVDVIEHIPDHRSAVRDIARVLDMNGRVVMTTLLADRPSYFRKVVFTDHVREYSLEQFENLFAQADLRVEHRFFFYRAPTMIARELQLLAAQRGVGRIPGLSLILGLFMRLLSDLEFLLPVGRPAGMGVVAVKAKPTLERSHEP
jgi:SAM-dependent methyltransferase